MIDEWGLADQEGGDPIFKPKTDLSNDKNEEVKVITLDAMTKIVSRWMNQKRDDCVLLRKPHEDIYTFYVNESGDITQCFYNWGEGIFTTVPYTQAY